jgi:hypothetical protein
MRTITFAAVLGMLMLVPTYAEEGDASAVTAAPDASGNQNRVVSPHVSFIARWN